MRAVIYSGLNNVSRKKFNHIRSKATAWGVRQRSDRTWAVVRGVHRVRGPKELRQSPCHDIVSLHFVARALGDVYVARSAVSVEATGLCQALLIADC